MLSPLAHFANRARSAIIVPVREPPAQWENAAVGSSELDQSNLSFPCRSLDVLLVREAKFPAFRRLAPGHQKLPGLLPELVRQPIDIPMTEPEPHKRKRMTAVQWRAASFEPTPRSIREARKFFGSVVTEPDMRETGELLVSELTTNALRHATGPFEVRVRARPRVRVEVRDRGRGLPVVKDLDTAGETGRGLQIVGRLARSWGTEELPDGKVVWFEL